jgi:hypothetical protein
VKQKSQASADFLGVLTVSKNLLNGCCIPTTILAIFVLAKRYPEAEKERSNGATGMLGRITLDTVPSLRKKPQR